MSIAPRSRAPQREAGPVFIESGSAVPSSPPDAEQSLQSLQRTLQDMSLPPLIESRGRPCTPAAHGATVALLCTEPAAGIPLCIEGGRLSRCVASTVYDHSSARQQDELARCLPLLQMNSCCTISVQVRGQAVLYGACLILTMNHAQLSACLSLMH